MSVLTSWRNKRTWYLASYDKNLPFHEANYKQLMMNVEDQLTKLMKALNSPQFRGKVEVYCPNLDGIVHPFFYYLHILMLFQTCMLFSPLSTEIKKCHSFLYSFFFFYHHFWVDEFIVTTTVKLQMDKKCIPGTLFYPSVADLVAADLNMRLESVVSKGWFKWTDWRSWIAFFFFLFP